MEKNQFSIDIDVGLFSVILYYYHQVYKHFFHHFQTIIIFNFRWLIITISFLAVLSILFVIQIKNTLILLEKL
jgi:hypothetical protein